MICQLGDSFRNFIAVLDELHTAKHHSQLQMQVEWKMSFLERNFFYSYETFQTFEPFMIN